MSIASQDFRDGAASGAGAVAKRARTIVGWGVPLDDRLLDKIAEGLAYEMGGSVFPMEDTGHEAPLVGECARCLNTHHAAGRPADV